MTALLTGSPKKASASFFIFCRIKAEICSGVYVLPKTWIVSRVPIFLFMPVIVLLVHGCLPSGWFTTSICPSLVNATTDGTVLPYMVVPSADGMIVGLPPSITAAQEFDVPRSIL